MPERNMRESAVVSAFVSLGKQLFARRYWEAALAGLGGFITILCLAGLTAYLDYLLLIAPFGASCVLVFGVPDSPLAQPRNVIGGHLISTAVGLVVLATFGPGSLSLAMGVGIAISAMMLTKTLHPPAGADPIVVIFAGASWPFLFVPVLAGTVFIVLMARAYRRASSWRPTRRIETPKG